MCLWYKKNAILSGLFCSLKLFITQPGAGVEMVFLQHFWDCAPELQSSIDIIKGDTDWQLLLAGAAGFPVPQLSFLPNIIYLTISL